MSSILTLIIHTSFKKVPVIFSIQRIVLILCLLFSVFSWTLSSTIAFYCASSTYNTLLSDPHLKGTDGFCFYRTNWFYFQSMVLFVIMSKSKCEPIYFSLFVLSQCLIFIDTTGKNIVLSIPFFVVTELSLHFIILSKSSLCSSLWLTPSFLFQQTVHLYLLLSSRK